MKMMKPAVEAVWAFLKNVERRKPKLVIAIWNRKKRKKVSP